MLIGTRIIKGNNCTMYQVSATRIEVSYFIGDKPTHTMAFVGKCDNAHIDAIWLEVAENVPDNTKVQA